MAEKARLYGDISPRHEADFMLIKGVYGCRTNGEALEAMIDKILPVAKKELQNKSVK